MSHFAKVHNGIVERVIVAEQEFFDEFTDNSPGDWIQCSYNTIGGVYYTPNTNGIVDPDQSKALRKNFPSVGFNYNTEMDAFYAQQPYPSWILNQQSAIWEPPIPKPENNLDAIWNEQTLSWE